MHLGVGHAIGGGAAALAARDVYGVYYLAELAGGVVGGGVGAFLPDRIEPATSPRHRSIAHSFTTAVGGTAIVAPRITPWQERARERAAQHRAAAASSADGWTRFWNELLAVFWHFVAGFTAGLPTGYLSHLGLDAFTPAGLPVLA